ncbi:hypothetical protein DF3PB_3020010 [uncultured Defluviicoccus sp.]|uniref:Uncharacterized protein n=1 Tax=metagenome TaxID=256318 RepID=A0A380TF16_9ZZZZ|nr:hypothetical protein [Defluviicoccus sp.]SUS06627.1 hypothetical protein DF3PB_3020010 [uncultured Defluviicoccus sp.]
MPPVTTAAAVEPVLALIIGSVHWLAGAGPGASLHAAALTTDSAGWKGVLFRVSGTARIV